MAELSAEEIDEFLNVPRDAVLSVVTRSGRAIGTPIWFLWADGAARFQSPTTTAKTAALRTSRRASLCVHEQHVPHTSYVTLEGPVDEVDFDLDRDIGAAARHYLGDGADGFMRGIDAALAAGRRWASFELRPTTIVSRRQTLS